MAGLYVARSWRWPCGRSVSASFTLYGLDVEYADRNPLSCLSWLIWHETCLKCSRGLLDRDAHDATAIGYARNNIRRDFPERRPFDRGRGDIGIVPVAGIAGPAGGGAGPATPECRMREHLRDRRGVPMQRQ